MCRLVWFLLILVLCSVVISPQPWFRMVAVIIQAYENGLVIIFSIPLFSCHFIVNFRLAMTIEAFSRGKVQDVGNWIKH